MAPGDATLLTALCPLRFHHAQWHLMYSTLRDGISMQTMLRQAQGKAPTFLVVRDMNRYAGRFQKYTFYFTAEVVLRLNRVHTAARSQKRVWSVLLRGLENIQEVLWHW